MPYSEGERWHNEAFAALDLFQQHGDMTALDTAIRLFRNAVAAGPPHDPDRGMHLRNLFVALHTKFSITHEREDLDNVLAAGRRAVQVPGGADLAPVLGNHLTTLFELTDNASALDEAIRILRRAAAEISPDHPNASAVLGTLCSALHDRFRAGGHIALLHESITLATDSLARFGEHDRNHPMLLEDLGNAWSELSDHSKDPAALDRAVDLLHRAARLVDETRRAAALNNLAAALRKRYLRLGDLDSLHAAIDLFRQAATAAPDADKRADMLGNLAQSLLARHEEINDPSALDEAVAVSGQAARMGRPNPARRAQSGFAQARALKARYARTGERADLDRAIELLREAVQAQPTHAAAYSVLGLALCDHFLHTGDTAALDEAARATRRAVALTPDGHAETAGRLGNLGSVLRTRFDRTRIPAVLGEAIEVFRMAVAATSADHPNRAGHLRNLGNALSRRSRLTGDLTQLDESIRLLREALDLARPGSADHASFSNDLGIKLRARYDHTRDRDTLDEAVGFLRRAAQAVATDDPVRADRLSNLGFALRQVMRFTDDPAVADEAAETFREAASTRSARPLHRIADAREWGRTVAETGDWTAAVSGFELAISLLPLVASRALARRDQEHGLSRLAGLASEGAACALQAGDAERAVRLLEQGRGVLITQQLDFQADLFALRQTHPDLAAAISELRTRSEIPAAEASPEDGLAQARRLSERRRAFADTWDALVARVRTLPGFHDFLALPPTRELLSESDAGPIVLLNVSDYRSDALVLTPAGIEQIPLPSLTPAAVSDRAVRFQQALASTRSPGPDEKHAQQVVDDTLTWLWDAVAEPVLEGLGLTGRPAGNWPRLWWSPTGMLAFLPLHAAGRHAERHSADPPTVLDRVVSSYTPTVRALRYARQRATITATGMPATGMLAISMPETARAEELSYAERETEALKAFLHTDKLSGPEATGARVRAALSEHAYVHFACHSVSDPGEPSASRLLLADHEADPLTVLDISRLNLPGARLAYLSACQTAQGVADLSDEAVHITSAFQLAGYPHVVGTLWHVNDRVAAHIASAVYTRMSEESGLRTEWTALSVHEAVRECRETYPATPSLWSAHIHAGA